MKEPTIKRFPTEVFCHPYSIRTQTVKNAIAEQYCRYLGKTCVKPRKSQPKIKIGVCSIGYKGEFLKDHTPIIICPHRFCEDAVSSTIKRLYLKSWKGKVEWINEVGMGVGGFVDRVAVLRKNSKSPAIDKFLCIEFQAAGTTGTPWKAVQELKKTGKYKSDDYPYGINWANEFIKTMMQQVYKKGKIVELWKERIVFVIQDVALEYLRNNADVSSIRKARKKDPIHFCTFSLKWAKDRWVLKFKEQVSTDLEGINKILGGSHAKHFPTTKEFKDSIFRRGHEDGIL